MQVTKHRVVAQEPDSYAGWPANHGAWQRGDEFLVGFMRGKYGTGSFHDITEPFEKMLARSIDGGNTWKLETPNVDFECVESIKVTNPPSFNPKYDIIRVCGRYDTGGEYCRQEGGFYLSRDFGVTWEGPFAFKGLEQVFGGSNHNTSRTRVVDGRIYLSAAKDMSWGSDWVFEASFHLETDTFYMKDIICKDNHRAVMPDVVQLGDRRVCVMRRKGRGRNWIDCFASDKGGPWRQLPAMGVTDTGWWNGNPAALAEVNGRLVCVYGHRGVKAICAKASDDGGMTWLGPVILRKSHDRDLGYPQLFKRSDGQLVCVYYISPSPGEPQCIMSTTFDPAKIEQAEYED